MTHTVNVNADLFRIAYGTVSQEETRYYLNGVLVEPHPCGGVFLVSTDGHRMTVIHDESGHADAPAIIRLSKDALKACKVKKTRRCPSDIRRLTVSDNLATVETAPCNSEGEQYGDSVIAATSTNAVIDGSFPDWRRVVPQLPENGEFAGTNSYNPKYIADFADMTSELGANHFRIVDVDHGSPALILFSGVPHAFGILMPVRDDIENAIPAFLHAKPEEAAAPEPETVETTETDACDIETGIPGSGPSIDAPSVAPSFKVPARLLASTGMSQTPAIPPVAPSCVLRIAA